MGEQHGGEGDPATGRAAEDLGLVLQAVGPQYLLLLAISQTCRFQGKSFLKFLLSKETDVDSFRRTRPVRYSYAVERQKDISEAP